jgi:hypothetical protein
VVLTDISPPLFRRLTVAAGITLATLHSRVLAPALGWHLSSHCYQFIDRRDGALYGPGRGEAGGVAHPLAECRDLPHLHVKGYAMLDDRDVRLVELVREGPPPHPRRTAVGKLRIVTRRFGTGRLKMAHERRTSPKLALRTCSPRYGLQS